MLPTRLSAILAVGLLLALRAAAGPMITLSTDEVNFGQVRQDTLSTQIVQVTNTGDALLQITTVKASCGCTGTRMDQKDIAPGQTAPLTVTFSAGKRDGAQDRTVYIYSNAVGTPSRKLVVRAVVIPTFTAAPASPDFGQVPASESATLEATISATAGPTPAVDKLTYDPKVFAVTSRGGGDGTAVTLAIRLLPGQPQGDLALPIMVTFAGHADPYVLQLRGSIVGPVVLNPVVATFVGPRGELVLQRKIAVSANDANAFQITGIQDKPDWLTYQVEPADGGGYSLTLSIDKATTPEKFRGIVQVQTDHPAMPTVPLRLWVMQYD